MARRAAGAPTTGGVKLVVFDFDQTLSVIHVFKSIAGWNDPDAPVRVPPPYACTELGQMRRIGELDRSGAYRDGFAVAAFGGRARVEQLRNCLLCLKQQGAELVICTKGLIGAVRRCLADLGLINLFDEAYGNLGDDAYGSSPYDKHVAKSEPTEEELQLLGNPHQASWGTKPELIYALMRERRLSREQAVIVEDDPEEIRRSTGVCRTLWVKEAAGVTPQAMEALQRMTVPDGSAPRSRGSDRSSAGSRYPGTQAMDGNSPLNRSGSGRRERRPGPSLARDRKAPSPMRGEPVPGGLEAHLGSGVSASRLGGLGVKDKARSCSQPPGAAPRPFGAPFGAAGQLPPLRRPPRGGPHDDASRRLFG